MTAGVIIVSLSMRLRSSRCGRAGGRAEGARARATAQYCNTRTARGYDMQSRMRVLVDLNPSSWSSASSSTYSRAPLTLRMPLFSSA